MSSLIKSGLHIGVAALMLTFSILLSTSAALAEAKPTLPKPACVPSGGVRIHGGSVTNTTNLDLSADGGTSIGAATGGDDNVALTLDDGDDDDDDIAAAGNGGSADSRANGGAIGTGNVNSGTNQGNAISVGNTISAGCAPLDSSGNPVASAAVEIDGGTVTNETNINVSADGGTAIADASGGDNNIAINGRAGNGGVSGISSAGNGGTAESSANGGAISIGDVNSGSNSGNVITVGNTITGSVPVPIKPVPKKPIPGKPVPGKPVPGKPAPPRELPTALPDTGSGSLIQGETNVQLLALVLAAATAMAAAAGQQALRGRAR